jgi:hypothetical protein
VNHGSLDPQAKKAEDLAQWATHTWKGDLISPSMIQRLAPNALRGDAKEVRSLVQDLCGAGVLDLIGKAQIDGKAYREVYRIIREGAAS